MPHTSHPGAGGPAFLHSTDRPIDQFRRFPLVPALLPVTHWVPAFLVPLEHSVNYPLWDLPASGLLIAAVAIVHVFISHFAVGGGLFLVVAEAKARREHDAALLAFVRTHSHFFVLLTLVGGAITGVGIWFTIGLVHPQATASLIGTFVWGWAIEWTFFLAEIIAAMIYYYGWDRLAPRVHLAVGWIYFANAFLSLVVINAILAYMLTPGAWLTTVGFWDGVFNPTYVPTLVARTAACAAIAGVYALLTAAWLTDPRVKARVARYAALRWVVPNAIVVLAALAWSLAAATRAGVPVAEIFGAPRGGIVAVGRALLWGSPGGYPMAQRMVVVTVTAVLATIALALVVALVRRERYGRPLAALVMVTAFVALGSAEWTREDLRKPYIIGQYMFVNGVRLPPPDGRTAEPAAMAAAFGPDRVRLDAIQSTGVLTASPWVPAALRDPGDPGDVAHATERGRAVFMLSCRACHTVDGYLGVRPLVKGLTVAGVTTMLGRLAQPIDEAGRPAAWNATGVQLSTWRNRRMPPFAGTPEEARALAVYLAGLGGASQADLAAALATTRGAADGRQLFEEQCAFCHGADAEFAFDAKGRSADEIYALVGRLPQVNDVMAPFEGTDAERRALAAHLATLAKPAR